MISHACRQLVTRPTLTASNFRSALHMTLKGVGIRSISMGIDGYALVTGAGSGIGKACALAYAREGAAGVAFSDINIGAAIEAAEESKRIAKNPLYSPIVIKVDVSDPVGVEEMMKSVIRSFPRLDYAVNSAGVGVEAPAEVSDASLDEFERFLKVNVTGTLLAVRAQSKLMKGQKPLSHPTDPLRELGRGAIINMGSGNSYVATPHIVQYTASKHAVIGITKNAALDNAPYGIRVNCLCPSWVSGPMIERAIAGNPGLADAMKKAVPIGRIAQPEEISDVVMFLSSPRSSYVTGAGWIVDGGATLQMRT